MTLPQAQPAHHASTIIPGLRYRDALPMLDWLCQVFGFEKHAVFTNPDGVLVHAQLTLGGGMVMVGTAENGTPSSSLLRQPAQSDGFETQAPYLVIADCEGAYDRAVRSGAQIVGELREQDYGGQSFSCRDPEGHLWNVGSYDPWAKENS